jgi:hypothetical protein
MYTVCTPKGSYTKNKIHEYTNNVNNTQIYIKYLTFRVKIWYNISIL